MRNLTLRALFILGALFLLMRPARADYVTVTQGGYGPSPCARDGGPPLPSRGFADLYLGGFYTGTCQRYRGDVATAGHVGRAVSLPADPFESVILSPQSTTHYSCYSIVPGNSPVPCESGYITDTASDAYTDWRNGSVLGYVPSCPTDNATAFNQLYICSGSYTPYDGSGIFTAIITDSHVSPGLPHGNPLKSQPAVGTDVSCLATMANYPNAPNGGHAQWMAVYSCP